MNVFYSLVKREIQEHKKGIIYQTIVIAGIIFVLVSAALLLAKFAGHHNNVNFSSDSSIQADTDAINRIELFFLVIVNIFYIIMFMLILRYLRSCLFKEREDKSILFWKSMPVSDCKTVLAKLFTAAIAIPAITISIFMSFHLAMLLFMSLTELGCKTHSLSAMWGGTHILPLWSMLIVNIVTQALWAAPLYGLYLLSSAYRKSNSGAGLFTGILIAGVLEKVITFIILEKSTSFILFEFTHRLIGGMFPWTLSTFRDSETIPQQAMGLRFNMQDAFGNMSYPVLIPINNPDLWYGLLCAVGFIVLTIFIRSRRT